MGDWSVTSEVTKTEYISIVVCDGIAVEASVGVGD